MDIKTAVIYRLNDLIKQKDITVNEAAVRFRRPAFNTEKYFVWTKQECWRSYN